MVKSPPVGVDWTGLDRTLREPESSQTPACLQRAKRGEARFHSRSLIELCRSLHQLTSPCPPPVSLVMGCGCELVPLSCLLGRPLLSCLRRAWFGHTVPVNTVSLWLEHFLSQNRFKCNFLNQEICSQLSKLK